MSGASRRWIDSGRAGSHALETAALLARLDRVRGTWRDDDPRVLVFPGETTPVVAAVDGEWRYLSDRVDVPRVADDLDVEVATFRRGDPSVEALSDQADRFGRADFERASETEADDGSRRDASDSDDRTTRTSGNDRTGHGTGRRNDRTSPRRIDRPGG